MSFNIQEFDHHLQNRVVDVGVSHGIRSYDCVFCRRGFTTAQALGGHMNIHRKDRASTTAINRPSNISTVDKSKEMLLENDNDTDNDNDNNEQVNTPTRLFFSPKSYFSSNQCHSNGGKSGLEGRLLSRVVQDEEEVDLELRLGHYIHGN